MFRNVVHVRALVNNSHNKTNKFVIYSNHFAAHLTLPSEAAAPHTHHPTPSKAGHVVSKLKTLLVIFARCPPPSPPWRCAPTWVTAFSFLRFLDHTPQSVGLLWTGDQPVAETST